MIKVAVIGVCGRMGTAVIKAAKDEKDLKIIGGVEAPSHPMVGERIDAQIPIVGSLKDVIKDADVAIDFSCPSSTIQALDTMVNERKAFVIGTTGFSDEQKGRIKDASGTIPILFSPNLSIGANILFLLVRYVASVLEGYHADIIELHHAHKKDAPSGTAKRILGIIAEAMERSVDEVAVYGRFGADTQRQEDTVGVFSLRAADIVGEHHVYFCTEGERIVLSHQVHSRICFAKGAIKMAKELVKKAPGLYDVQDVLKI
jgi:4-hydroxy-tetrahydrodipicolinate reductase